MSGPDEVYNEALHTYEPDIDDDRPTPAELAMDDAKHPWRLYDVTFAYVGRKGHVQTSARTPAEALARVQATHAGGDFSNAQIWELCGLTDDHPF